MGGMSVSSLGIFLAAGFIAGSFLVWRYLRDSGTQDEKIFDNIIVVAIVTLLGARAGFVLLHWSIFAPHPLFMFLLWSYPGLSFWGALVSALLVIFLYSKKQKLPFSLIADSYGRALPTFMFFLSLALFLDGTVTGKETTWITALPAVGVLGKRHPVALYGVILAFIAQIAVIFLDRELPRRQVPRGFYSLIMLSYTGFVLLILAFTRADLLYLRGISLDHVFATIVWIVPFIPIFLLLNGPARLEKLVIKIKNSRKNNL
jgi:prolipoprotein diacylglyceryltransferase